ncbi:hypothetical protein CL652_02910 [bacterium]|nr:hypothetical protein [bacterium]|tara:strand:- start:13734 stop:14885 length:1152 start_codon:yes stop_codon:yes gene_type:complete
MNVLSLLPGFSKALHVLVFDIGSASVGVAIARYREGTIDVLFTHREPIAFGDEQDAAALGSYVGAAIKAAGKEAIEALGRLEGVRGKYDVRAIVHTPWADSRSDRAESTLDAETMITKEVLQQFIAQQLPVTATKGRIEFDRHVMKIELNGYATTKPYKKRAESIAVTVLKSSMSEVIHTAIQGALADVLPNHSVHIDAFLFAAMQLNKSPEEHDAYTIVDVGGEYTSISIVRNEAVEGSSWVNFGTEYLVRTIAKGDEMSRLSAVSELTMYINNSCTPAQCRKIEKLLQDSEQEWIKTFGDACSELSRIRRIPTTTFISIDKRYKPWFAKAIERLDFGQFTVTGKPLETKSLSTQRTGRELIFKENAKKDSMLSLGVLFVDK